MKRVVLAVSFTLACALMVNAQKAESRATGEASSQTTGSVNQAAKSINIQSGTRLAAELQNAIDARKARVGDQVALRTTQAITSEGRTVVPKGARLLGHVTEVSQKNKNNDESRVGLLFDRLERGALEIPITATISSITSGRATMRANNDDGFGPASASSSASSTTSAQGSSSGLLGGVGGVVNSTTATVGQAIGSTTAAVGSTVNSTTNTAGRTTSGLGRSLGRIQISESSNTSVEGSSVLSLQGENLRLEKGTTFNLMISQSASTSTQKDQ